MLTYNTCHVQIRHYTTVASASADTSSADIGVRSDSSAPKSTGAYFSVYRPDATPITAFLC